MKHFMAQHTSSGTVQVVFHLQVIIPNPFAVNINHFIIERPAMRPQQRCPGCGSSPDNEYHIIDIAIKIFINIQIVRHFILDILASPF